MPSSVIANIEYDDSRQQLFIHFLSGTLYVYYDVPKKVFQSFRSAISKGKYFNRYIKGIYSFQELQASKEP